MEHRALKLVENITRHRDFESLEEHFLDNLTQLFPVAEIRFAYLDEDAASPIVDRLVVGLLDPQNKKIKVWKETNPMEPPGAHEQRCLNKRALLEYHDVVTDACSLYFPLEDDKHNIFAIVSISSEESLSANLGTFEAVAKIYRNYLAVIHESETDQLTGLLNRKRFEAKFNRLVEIQHECARADGLVDTQRRGDHSGDPSWLAILDIDFFKSVNDNYGHIIGDEILILVSRLMQKCMRRDDLLFRFGGEEFVILLSPATKEQAKIALERLRKTIDEYDFPQVKNITVSIGFTEIDLYNPTSNTLGVADQALYYAKDHGRNQVHCYETLVEENKIKSAQCDNGSIELF